MPRQGLATIGYPGTEEADARALRGYGAYLRGGDELMHQEREDRLTRHEALAEQLEQSRINRELAKDQLLAERKLRIDAVSPQAMRELNSINPNDDDAMERILKHGANYAELYDGELGDKRMGAYYDARIKAAQAAMDRRNKADEYANARKERQQDRLDILGQQQDFRTQMAQDTAQREAAHQKEREQDRRDTALGIARDHYETASDYARHLQQQIADTEGFLKEQTGKKTITPTDQGHIDRMIVSRDRMKYDLAREQAKIKGMEERFPELNPAFKQKTDKGTTDTATKTVANAAPNSDVPSYDQEELDAVAASQAPAQGQTQPPVATGGPDFDAALQWANANPDDPRAATILKRVQQKQGAQ